MHSDTTIFLRREPKERHARVRVLIYPRINSASRDRSGAQGTSTPHRCTLVISQWAFTPLFPSLVIDKPSTMRKRLQQSLGNNCSRITYTRRKEAGGSGSTWNQSTKCCTRLNDVTMHISRSAAPTDAADYFSWLVHRRRDGSDSDSQLETRWYMRQVHCFGK